MKRSKPLKRSPIARKPSTAQKIRNSIARVNRERKKRRFRECYDSPEFVAWVQSLPCVACGYGPSEAAHARSRGAGGKASDIVPLCADAWATGCHRLSHELGIKTFERLYLYGVSLRALAAETWARWLALQEEAA